MYEVWQERLVTQDGQAQGATEGHRAVVTGDGTVELRLHAADILLLRTATADRISVRLTDLRAALDDLERLAPFSEPSSEDGAMAERAAQAVELACEHLDPELARDLRTAVLELIGAAQRPAGTATLPTRGA